MGGIFPVPACFFEAASGEGGAMKAVGFRGASCRRRIVKLRATRDWLSGVRAFDSGGLSAGGERDARGACSVLLRGSDPHNWSTKWDAELWWIADPPLM